MNTLYTEDSIKHVAESLLDHARSVYKYAANYCHDDDDNARLDAKTRRRFRRNADRLVQDLYAMMLLSRHNSIGAFCNLEQVEAYYEAAREILDAKQDVVRYAGLFN